ncbi:MAG: formylglycine-generating enzyme family protein, partial [Bacteroidetes bacterium]|nr:formylglycine-generating enzyme family protein [Bacteroidota bacterium]
EGTFTMGAATATYGPVAYPHQVTLSDYWIGQTEVTQGLWEAVMGTTYPGETPSSYGKGSNYPVYYISWDNIVGTASSGIGYTVRGMTYYQDGFCYKLSQKYNDGRQYRLPTEAEWEYAAREGSSTNNYDYSGSNTINDVAWYGDNSGFTSHIVGSKQANKLGIYDMCGNVVEWCWDLYKGEEYGLGAVENPTGASEGYEHAVRGGSWGDDPKHCCVTIRETLPYYRAGNTNGFRLAL